MLGSSEVRSKAFIVPSLGAPDGCAHQVKGCIGDLDNRLLVRENVPQQTEYAVRETYWQVIPKVVHVPDDTVENGDLI